MITYGYIKTALFGKRLILRYPYLQKEIGHRERLKLKGVQFENQLFQWLPSKRVRVFRQKQTAAKQT